ncbi:MAG: hypothetical protein ABIJ85_02300 [bacterium]
MPIERIKLIHQIREDIIEPNTFYDESNLESRFLSSLESIQVRSDNYVDSSPLVAEKVDGIKGELVEHFISVASDLGTFDLAKGHIDRLFNHLLADGATSEKDLLREGSVEFYKVSRFVLGPLWSLYVDEVFSNGDGNGVYLFAARDATPIYWAAEGILSSTYKHSYSVENSSFVHVDWNRWFMGQEDETDGGVKPLPFDHPLMKTFYGQMGFGNGQPVKIVEPGAWGSAANALRTIMPEQDFELWFMFSHMPQYIYGFLNSHAPDIDPKYFEMINDTAEAVPKAYRRPTTLTVDKNKVVADLTGKIIESPYIKTWSWAVNQGAYDAGVDFAAGKRINVRDHVQQIIALSKLSQQGQWTGVLPRNTLTWTEGENWKNNWKWGKIPPLI